MGIGVTHLFTGAPPVGTVGHSPYIKGMVRAYLDPMGLGSYSGAPMKIGILGVSGAKVPNAQFRTNIGSNMYYTLFGELPTQFTVECIDLPGSCYNVNGRSIVTLSNMVKVLGQAIRRSNLPLVKINYVDGEGQYDNSRFATDAFYRTDNIINAHRTVQIEGYLSKIDAKLEPEYKHTFTLTLIGYMK